MITQIISNNNISYISYMNSYETNQQKLPPIKRNARSKNGNNQKGISQEYLEQNHIQIQNHQQEKKNGNPYQINHQKNQNLQNFEITHEISLPIHTENQAVEQNPYQTKQPKANHNQYNPNLNYPQNFNRFEPQPPYPHSNNPNAAFQPEVQEKQFPRQQRIGCCCFSVHRNHYCCNMCCMYNCCHHVQRGNYACYCHNLDCIYCCVHVACRVCCYDKNCCDCVVQCCRHMPLCLILDCIKEGKCCNGECGSICGSICDCILKCHPSQCECIGQICGAICQILCCFFK